MNNLSTLSSTTYAGKRNWWQWLLRGVGLESWFRQAPTAAHAGQQEHIVLLLTLAAGIQPPTLLADALRLCAPLLEATGGKIVTYRPGTLLLAWPTGVGQPLPPVAALYFQLRDRVRHLAGSDKLGVGGAAGLGWATSSTAEAAHQYTKAGLSELAGILHESQQLGSELLLSAALHHRLALAVAEQCALHVAFGVPGHRYPATLYRVLAPASA